MKSELEVLDDSVDHGIVSEESNDAHFPLAFGAAQGINLIDFHLGPAPPGSGRDDKESV